MQWFDTTARVLIIAVVVLLGASLVRSVTDALSMATYGQAEFVDSAR